MFDAEAMNETCNGIFQTGTDDMLKELTIQFQEAKKLNLKLNMARGKPAAAQLDMNMGLLEFPEGCTLEDGTGCKELRRFRRNS